MFPPVFRRYHPIFALFFRALVRSVAPRVRVSGRRNIPHRGPVIFAPNHLSDVDPPFIGAAIRRPVAWMAKRELWEIGWLGPILDFVGSFPVDPASPDRAALRQGLDVLKRGDALVVFPEGKIAPDAQLGPLLPGALLIAFKSGAPVVPLGMWGVENVMPYGETRPRVTFSPVHLHFGAPLKFDDLKDENPRRAREIAAERLETALREAIEVARCASMKRSSG